jgi:hypothetical protein
MVNPNCWTPSWARGILVICSLALSFQLMGQQMPSESVAPGPAKAGEGTESAKVPGHQDQSRPRKGRSFWGPVNLLTVDDASHVPPLSAGGKFKLAAGSAFAPYKYPYAAVRAGFSQARNTEPGYGQGSGGYVKRYGSAFADSAIGGLMTKAAFPSLLRQDPRYYQMARGSFSRRAVYAASRILITRMDSGKQQFNFSEFLGRAMAAGIANAYHPFPRTLGDSINIWWSSVAWDAAANELKEFWPDVRRRLHKH